MTAAVRQIAVPQNARAESTLARIDYADAYVIATAAPHARAAEEWARLILEGAPASLRRALVSGWSAIGLKLEGPVLGWSVRRSTPDLVLLGAGSRVGLPGELLFKRRQRTLLFATFVQQQNPLARTLWAGVEPVHARVVPRVLAGALDR